MTVYFVQDGGAEGHVKIGYTGTAAGAFGRIAQLQTGNPRPMKLLVCIPNGTAAEEKALHERFKDLRGSGEWFRPDARLLGFIEGLRVAYPEQPKDPGPIDDKDAEFALAFGVTYEQLDAIRAYCARSRMEAMAYHSWKSVTPRSTQEAHNVLEAIALWRREARHSRSFAYGLQQAELLPLEDYETAALAVLQREAEHS